MSSTESNAQSPELAAAKRHVAELSSLLLNLEADLAKVDSLSLRQRQKQLKKQLNAALANVTRLRSGREKARKRGVSEAIATSRRVVEQAKLDEAAAKRSRLRRLLSEGEIAGPRTALGVEFRAAWEDARALKGQLSELKLELIRANSSENALRARLAIDDVRDRLKQAIARFGSVQASVFRRDDARRFPYEPSAKSRPATQLLWRVLPPGTIGRKMLSSSGNGAYGGSRHLERLVLLDSLNPLHWYEGSHLGETVYFVAEFANVAIADSEDYGNALYYCLRSHGDWTRVFAREKQEARNEGARRIVHTGDWEERVRRLVGAR